MLLRLPCDLEVPSITAGDRCMCKSEESRPTGSSSMYPEEFISYDGGEEKCENVKVCKLIVLLLF